MQTVVRKLQIAITRRPSSLMQIGERTFAGREWIDAQQALSQHATYCDALAACGFEVRTIEADDALADCSFVEDCAVTLTQSTLICRPGAESRLPEVAAVADALPETQEIVRVQPPATLEGGDVLRFGNRLWVGRSTRTNAGGIAALRAWAEPLGYSVTECAVHGCLHLKTACTFLPDGSLLANEKWIEVPNDLQIVSIADDEPCAGNILLVNETAIAATNQPKTNQMIRDRGFEVIEVDISEFQKAEGGVTCLSILIGN
jgi:dimethylargininase